jgi:hypothetical protein
MCFLLPGYGTLILPPKDKNISFIFIFVLIFIFVSEEVSQKDSGKIIPIDKTQHTRRVILIFLLGVLIVIHSNIGSYFTLMKGRSLRTNCYAEEGRSEIKGKRWALDDIISQ